MFSVKENTLSKSFQLQSKIKIWNGKREKNFPDTHNWIEWTNEERNKTTASVSVCKWKSEKKTLSITKNENTTWNKLPEVQDKDWNEVKPCCTWFTHCNRHSAVCTYLPLPNGKQYAKIFSSRCSNKLSFNIFGKTFWWFIEIVFPLPKNNNFKWYAQRKLGEFSFVCV